MLTQATKIDIYYNMLVVISEVLGAIKHHNNHNV